MRRRASTCRGASALLLVLWTLLMLSAAVLAWAEWLHGGLVLHGAANRALEARAMAHSGLAVALHPVVTLRTPVPPEEIEPGMGYEVRRIGEGGKLNINWLLRGEEPGKLALLKQWLEQHGLNLEQRETFVDSLLDYMDGDNIKRLNGREDGGPYHPPNRELQSVDEIGLVSGAVPLTAQPGWQDELTVLSQGPIDLNSASMGVLKLLPGLGETRIQQFIKQRRGLDGIDGTADDEVFQNFATVRQFFGLSVAQFSALENLIGYDDPTLHITSFGHSGKIVRKVVVVARKQGGSPQILSWKE